jgi:uncharacterized protein (DUF4415 family)
MTDWKHIDTMKDEDIDLSDIPELNDDFFREAELVVPQKQSPITISLDRDVLEWFRSRGKEYQALINAILRAYMKTQRPS